MEILRPTGIEVMKKGFSGLARPFRAVLDNWYSKPSWHRDYLTELGILGLYYTADVGLTYFGLHIENIREGNVIGTALMASGGFASMAMYKAVDAGAFLVVTEMMRQKLSQRYMIPFVTKWGLRACNSVMAGTMVFNVLNIALEKHLILPP